MERSNKEMNRTRNKAAQLIAAKMFLQHCHKILPPDGKLRRVKYLNNVIEQDHRFIKEKV
jgi:transposase-like protein